MTKETINWSELSELEKLKFDSDYLRGTLVESLADPITGAIAEGDTQISKFHGIYQQYDRDTERDRKKSKLEPGFQFLIRVRLPGGMVSPEQWIAMDNLADTYANHTLKLTTRQAFQLHGVLKKGLKPTIKKINDALMDTIAACGDVNRNVMCHPNPAESEHHAAALKLAEDISRHLTPATHAYHEIWLDEKKVASSEEEVEPIYGNRYLPRKFKISVVIPPYNDSDIFAQDLGYIGIVENGKLTGYNVTVGGGMGSTFGMPETYPRLAEVIGFCTPEQAVDVAEKVVLVQKDNGNRQNRKRARLKYTIDDRGIDWFKKELNTYLGYDLKEPKKYTLSRTGDRYGWKKGNDNQWHLTLYVEGGRVRDNGGRNLKTALREIAEFHKGRFCLTGNQNLIITEVNEKNKKKVNDVLKNYNALPETLSGLRRNSIACVALNTCGLAFAEAERYLPDLLSKIEVILEKYGLSKDEIVIRMTGCPNGCGRPYLAEIGFIGKALGKYNLYLGGSFNGNRLNRLYLENISENEILQALEPILKDYAENRNKDEKFGDFILRKQYVEEVKVGSDFKH